MESEKCLIGKPEMLEKTVGENFAIRSAGSGGIASGTYTAVYVGCRSEQPKIYDFVTSSSNPKWVSGLSIPRDSILAVSLLDDNVIIADSIDSLNIKDKIRLIQYHQIFQEGIYRSMGSY